MNKGLLNNLINQIQKAYLQRSLENALALSEEAIDAAQSPEFSSFLGKLYILKGKILNKKGQYANDDLLLDQAMNCFEQAQMYSKFDIEIYLNCGHLYLNKENYNVAHRYFDKVLKIAQTQNKLEMTIKAMSGKSKILIAEKKFKDAFELAEQAVMLLDDEVKKRTQLNVLGVYIDASFKMGKFPIISKYSLKVQQLAEELGDIEYKAETLNISGISLAKKGEYSQAFTMFLQSKEYSEQIQFHALTAKCLINIANVLSSLTNLEEAYQAYYTVYSSLTLYNALDEYSQGALLYNLGTTAFNSGRKQEAIAFLQKARVLGLKTENPRLISRSLYDLIRIYLKEENYEIAIPLAKETVEFHDKYKEIGDSESHLANMAEINYFQGNYTLAIKFGIQAAQRASEVQNHKTRKRSYKILSDIYKKMKNYEKAYFYLDLFTQASEALYQEMRKRTMLDLERKYETNKKEKEIELLKSRMEIQSLELNQKISNLYLKALQSQMNPHFIFNALNGIQKFITSGENEQAMIYLAKFAKLIRMIFEQSKKEQISLEEEVDFLKLYLSLEKFRFQDKINVDFQIDEDISQEDIFINPLLIQPIIENAFKHGLMHLEKGGYLTVILTLNNDYLLCIIEDNGVGRKKAKELSVWKHQGQKSSGINTTQERLNIINNDKNNNPVKIIDLKNGNGVPKGTRVELNIKVTILD